MSRLDNLNFEAESIGNYLLNFPIREKEKELYMQAMISLEIKLSKTERRVMDEMLQSKWKMAALDGGLALKDPNGNIRRKFFTMLAILEASPHYTSYFLSRDFSFVYYFKLIFIGLRAVFRTIIGLLLLKTIK